MASHNLTTYPVLRRTIATIIHNILIGLLNKKPIHIGIDNPYFVQNYQSYKQTSLKFWESHLSAYRVVYGSVAVSSIAIKLEHQQKSDIFEEGTYFYNCRSGSFEIEVNSKGELSRIIAEFDGNTPSFIAQLLKHFPEEAFPGTDEVKKEISQIQIVNDKLFLSNLQPLPYELIAID